MLEGEKIYLREISMEDLDWIFESFRDFEFRRFLGHPVRFQEVTKENERKWIEKRIEEIKEMKRYLFVIVSKEKNEPAGLIDVFDIKYPDGTAEIGYWVRRDFWGKGYATEAVKLILRFCKEVLNLRKVIARVYSKNKASIRVLEKNGFELVGRLKEHAYIPFEGYDDELIFERFL